MSLSKMNDCNIFLKIENNLTKIMESYEIGKFYGMYVNWNTEKFDFLNTVEPL